VKGALGRTKIRQQLPPASQLVNKEKRISAELFMHLMILPQKFSQKQGCFWGRSKHTVA